MKLFKNIITTFLLLTSIVIANSNSKTALLIIDIQEFYFPGGRSELVNPKAAAAEARKLLNKFREKGMLVIHVQHKVNQEMEINETVKPLRDEKVITKTQINSFNGTDLFDFLKEKGIENVIICGMQTHKCVEAAVRAAYDLGFTVTVSHDACATRDVEFNGVKVAAAEVHASTMATISQVYGRVVKTSILLEELSNKSMDTK